LSRISITGRFKVALGESAFADNVCRTQPTKKHRNTAAQKNIARTTHLYFWGLWHISAFTWVLWL